jgi:hypothetical protein
MTDDDGDFFAPEIVEYFYFFIRKEATIPHFDFVQPCQPKVVLRYSTSSVSPQSIPSTNLQGLSTFSCFLFCFCPTQVLAKRYSCAAHTPCTPHIPLAYSSALSASRVLLSSYQSSVPRSRHVAKNASSWSHGPPHRHATRYRGLS